MTEIDNDGLKRMLHRERSAKEQAEALLEERTRDLYIANTNLQKQYAALNSAHETLKFTQSQLAQSSKLAAIGQLSAGIAHEINNPLAFIKNNIEQLSQYTSYFLELLSEYAQLKSSITNKDYPQVQNQIEKIITTETQHKIPYITASMPNLLTDTKEGIDRVADIISNLKNFARSDDNAIDDTNINDCIKSALKIIRHQIQRKCEIIEDYTTLPLIKANSGQLNQVFINLLLNAEQAIANTGVINIKTKVVQNKIHISIQDNGKGIPEAYLEKIFDPFFTTKPIGMGTGLGLSISKNIITEHHGEIKLESKLGVGTTFIIILPID